MKSTLKLIRRKFYRALLCHVGISLCLVSLTVTAQPSRLLEFSGWRDGEQAVGLDERARARDERSVKRGSAPAEYQPREKRERMSPEDRRQLRRDVRDAGRDIYPEEKHGRHHGGRN
ncbi:MAG: hypothetical protein Q7J21_08130 [Rugosibacter sp.]|nr:hypothetical protein [Rugosibacter sp.]